MTLSKLSLETLNNNMVCPMVNDQSTIYGHTNRPGVSTCIFKDFVTICWESYSCHSPAFHPRRFPPERKTVKVKVVDSTFLFYD